MIKSGVGGNRRRKPAILIVAREGQCTVSFRGQDPTPVGHVIRNGRFERPAHDYGYGKSNPELRPTVPEGE